MSDNNVCSFLQNISQTNNSGRHRVTKRTGERGFLQKHTDPLFTVWRKGRLNALHWLIKATHPKVTDNPFCTRRTHKTSTWNKLHNRLYLLRKYRRTLLVARAHDKNKNIEHEQKTTKWHIYCCALYGCKVVFWSQLQCCQSNSCYFYQRNPRLVEHVELNML